MLARLLRRAFRVLLRANTGPVDALVYALALCWLAFLALTPDAAFARAGLGGMLAYKGVWLWPALGKVVGTPLGWGSAREWVHRAARVYAVMWWVYLTVATAIVTPGIVLFWSSAACCALAAFWLFAREGAGAVDLAAPRR